MQTITENVQGIELTATPAQHAKVRAELAYWYPRCSNRLLTVDSDDEGFVYVRSERTPQWAGLDRKIDTSGEIVNDICEQQAHEPDLSPDALAELVRDALYTDAGEAYRSALTKALASGPAR